VRYYGLVTIMYTKRLLDCPSESYIYENVFTFVSFTIKSLVMHSRFNKIVYCSVSNEKEPSLQTYELYRQEYEDELSLVIL